MPVRVALALTSIPQPVLLKIRLFSRILSVTLAPERSTPSPVLPEMTHWRTLAIAVEAPIATPLPTQSSIAQVSTVARAELETPIPLPVALFTQTPLIRELSPVTVTPLSVPPA